MDIQINDQFRLTSDPLNVVLEQSFEKKREDENSPIEFGWRKIGYYNSIEQACKDILRKTINNSDATALYELLRTIKQVETNIISAIQTHSYQNA